MELRGFRCGTKGFVSGAEKDWPFCVGLMCETEVVRD